MEATITFTLRELLHLDDLTCDWHMQFDSCERDPLNHGIAQKLFAAIQTWDEATVEAATDEHVAWQAGHFTHFNRTYHPHDKKLHTRLVEVMAKSYAGGDVRWSKGYVRAVRELLTLWYGEDEALRVLERARTEAEPAKGLKPPTSPLRKECSAT